jgi:hypothetical protein
MLLFDMSLGLIMAFGTACQIHCEHAQQQSHKSGAVIERPRNSKAELHQSDIDSELGLPLICLQAQSSLNDLQPPWTESIMTLSKVAGTSKKWIPTEILSPSPEYPILGCFKLFLLLFRRE